MPLPPLSDPAGTGTRIVRLAKAVPVTALGFASLLLFNAAQTASLLLLPFSRKAFRRFNRWCANTWWGACVVASQRLNRTQLVVTGEDVPEGENALVLSNHQNMPDIVVADDPGPQQAPSRRPQVLRQARPEVGAGSRLGDAVHRLSLRAPRLDSRPRADPRTFDTLVRERIPVWLVSFAEGTRSTPDKLREPALSGPLDHGLEATRHVLIPRSKGFVATIDGLGDHLDAVYDVTIGYVDGVPTLWQYITGSVKRIHVHVRRFPIESLPRLEHELRDWLLTRYREKDALLDHYYAHGTFPAEA